MGAADEADIKVFLWLGLVGVVEVVDDFTDKIFRLFNSCIGRKRI